MKEWANIADKKYFDTMVRILHEQIKVRDKMLKEKNEVIDALIQYQNSIDNPSIGSGNSRVIVFFKDVKKSIQKKWKKCWKTTKS